MSRRYACCHKLHEAKHHVSVMPEMNELNSTSAKSNKEGDLQNEKF